MGPTTTHTNMRPTRRAYTAAALTAFLNTRKLLLADPLPFVGAVGILAALLAAQLRFVLLLDETLPALDVDQQVTRPRVSAHETTPVTLAVTHPSPLPIAVDVTARPPAGADGDDAAVHLPTDARDSSTDDDPTTTTDPTTTGPTTTTDTVEVTWPAAGTVTLETPMARLTDPAGLFTQHVARGSTPTVTVEPRRPRNVHVGEGGEPLAVGFGEHEAGRLGSGLEPAEVRQYVPGDTIRQMDWKATARLDAPHVREFEAETDRETVLVLDHRTATAVGPPGETALDYLRQVAIAFVDSARDLADPIGCVTVGDGNEVTRFDARADAAHVRAVRRHLQAVGTREGPDRPGGRGRSDAADGRGRHDAGIHREARDHRDRREPAPPRQRLALLADDAPLARTLRPFFDRPRARSRLVAEDPLFAAVRSVARQVGRGWTVVLTTDDDPAEVRDAVAVARRQGGHVLVFLAPTVLYETDGLADLETAYERYRSFEGLRRDLAGMERVRAFEVGPADRLSQVLATGRRDTERGRGQ
mgnify:CR=1 FL=1